MKKKRFIIIAVAVLLVIAAAVICFKMFGGSHTGIDNNPESKLSNDSKVLVAYFSWSGNGQQMARWISEETGGDLFRIVPAEPYGKDFDSCADRAKNELDNGIRPELSEHIEKQAMEQYNVIYIGFPVWCFLEEYDLSGKTVIPFFSHNGSSNGAGSVSRISELAKGAKVLTEDALSIPGRSVSGSEKEVKEWAAERLNENQ